MEKRIDISKPSIGDDEWEALRGPINSAWLTGGPEVRAFEEEFAARHGSKHAVATTSCTTALHLILAALDLKEGDEVILPAFTWIATANVIRYCGATPVFCDVEPTTYNLSAATVESKITSRTRAILPVHLFGLCCDVASIEEMLDAKKRRDIRIVEDAACATGSSIYGKPAGSLGYAAAFSFHPRKILTTGEGGMITTTDSEFAQKLQTLRNHGATISEERRHSSPRPFEMPDFEDVGFNYRLTDLQAAIGRVQLKKLDSMIEQRRAFAKIYMTRLGDLGYLRLPVEPIKSFHSYQAFVCTVDSDALGLSRDQVLEKLLEEKISGRSGTHCVPHQRAYQKLGFRGEDYPVSLALERQTLALPLHNCMSPEDCMRVVDVLAGIGG